MKLRSGLGVAALAAACAWWSLSARNAPADPQRDAAPPPVVLLEGPPDGAETRVVLRSLASNTPPRVLGVVPLVAGSARRGTVAAHTGVSPRVYVVAAERPSRHGSTYESALWRIDAGAPAVRLAGALTDASRALVTERGSVVVQRGRDGDEPTLTDHVLRERVDALSLDVVGDDGALRAAWTGRGMIAFLAAPLRGDEVLVYYVHAGGASLFALDVGTRATRTLIDRMDPLARDFSYDATRDEVAFVRASERRAGVWEVVTVPAHGPPLAPSEAQVRWRAASDHLMPRLLRDGALMVSLPDDKGLAVIEAFPRLPSRVAPLGDGADEALGESDDGRWVALRHRTQGREVLGLYERASHRAVQLDEGGDAVEFAGFATVTP